MAPALMPVLAAALALAFAGRATAQDGNLYRQGLPPVLSPETAAPAEVSASFSEAYRAQGRPRIIVFWMKPLSDRPASDRVRVGHAEETVVVGAYSARIGVGQRSLSYGEAEGFIPERTSDPLPLSISREAESAFMQTLAQAGVHVVDRVTATRLSAASSNDPRVAETAALTSKADYLIEVTGVADGLRAGWPVYRVDIRSLKDGRIVASLSTDAEPRSEADAEFVAVPGRGYVEVPGTAHGKALGQELAWQAMERMAEAWRR